MVPGPLDQVIEAMVDVVLVVDVQGRIIAANSAAIRVTGYDRAALAVLPVATLIVDEASGLRTVVRERVSHGTPLSRTDSWLVARGGERLPVSVTAAPIVDHDGVAASIVVVARDVRTVRELVAQRDAEIARREVAEAELRMALASIEQRLEQSRAQLLTAERRATLGTLAGGVGHELRNIAQLYAGQLDSLEHEVAQLPPNEVLDLAVKDLARIGQHVADHARRLMELARPGPSHAQRLNINRVIGEVAAMLQGAGRLNRIETELALEDRAVMVTVNATRIEQILVNLVINAVQAMPNGGKLLISACPLDGRVEIQIHDTGDGIAPDVLPHIFEPFFTTRTDGTGLGLPVVKEIVESYGGTIDVDSTPGIGTTFRFDLPLSRG
ncbi:MAG TPA: ATP-binding protein [Kofleriaceae bacterium]|jgi:PAS domain S-box-containing protein|nr:ATP-binding protein [Kofleriaceae bacterium]